MDPTKPTRVEAPWGWLATPVVAPLLRDRRTAAAFAAAGVAQVGLTLAHVGGMPCPFLSLTGLPCPGCGLSRACAALCRGDWATAVRLHAFAPVVLLALALLAAAAVLPAAARDRLASAIATLERQGWVGPVLLGLLLLYWIVRVGYAPAEVARITSPGN